MKRRLWLILAACAATAIALLLLYSWRQAGFALMPIQLPMC
ncbi:hypothetical protein ACLO87_07155 [Paenalcaligenes sp. Me52]|jgi:cytochrome c-type biogenesis protein CcmE